MEPIAIVKKRSRIWLVMALILAALLVAAALFFMGDTAPTGAARGLIPEAGALPEPWALIPGASISIAV
jgi:hypothetical protein